MVFAAFTSIPGNVNNFKTEKRKSCPLYTGKNAYRECLLYTQVLYDFLVTVKAAPHECVIRTGQP